MKKGDYYTLKRGKKNRHVEILHDHSQDDPPFPAVTVRYRSEEWIVGVNELSKVKNKEEEFQEKVQEFLASKNVPEMLEAISVGNGKVRDIAEHMGVQMIDIVSKFRKAIRLGVIREIGGSIVITRKEAEHEQKQASQGQS